MRQVRRAMRSRPFITGLDGRVSIFVRGAFVATCVVEREVFLMPRALVRPRYSYHYSPGPTGPRPPKTWIRDDPPF